MSRAYLHAYTHGPQRNNDNLYFERRACERRAVSGRATALASSPGMGHVRNRICSIQLVDLSDTGLGGICQEPLEVGSAITVFVAPHGADRGYDLTGTVVRCAPHAHGAHIGIRFAHRMAA